MHLPNSSMWPSFSLNQVSFFLVNIIMEARKFNGKRMLLFNVLTQSSTLAFWQIGEELFNLVKKHRIGFTLFPPFFIGFTASTSNRHLIDAMLGYDTFSFKVFWCSYIISNIGIIFLLINPLYFITFITLKRLDKRMIN